MQDLRSTSPTGLTNRAKKLPFKKRVIKLIGRLTFAGMLQTAGLLRPWSIKMLGNLMGSAFYMLSGRYRGVALKNLRAAYGNEKTDAEIKTIAKQVFQHFTRAGFEFFNLLSLKREQIDAMVDLEGKEHLDKALADGKGCIVITAHYGNWELLARKIVMFGHKVSVVARDSDDPCMTGITTKIRESSGCQVYDRDQPIIGAFRCLKRNEILGILPDQNESMGIYVDYFSRPVATATGPAVLALKSGAAVVPAFAVRMADGRYKATVYPRIEYTPCGDEEKDIHDLTALITNAIEKEVRKNPSQWLWLHDRWKSSDKAPINNGK